MSNFEIKEESSYETKQISLRDILLGHIKAISSICCKELIPGYWENRPVKMEGGVFMSKVYHEDLREAFSNAVDFLIDILYPMGDDKFKQIVDEHEKKEFSKEQKEERMKAKRKIFKEINKMFERTNFFSNQEYLEE